MANILDIRRRIRSVTNTRQITKAMKMVSAAKLRRAQDRALAARPYAQMLTNVLKSLVTRAEVYDPETGEPKHPLLAQRPENRILLIVVTGDKGLPSFLLLGRLRAAPPYGPKFRLSCPNLCYDVWSGLRSRHVLVCDVIGPKCISFCEGFDVLRRPVD